MFAARKTREAHVRVSGFRQGDEVEVGGAGSFYFFNNGDRVTIEISPLGEVTVISTNLSTEERVERVARTLIDVLASADGRLLDVRPGRL